MSNLTILGRIEDFSRNDDVFELKVDNKIFIKHKHNNSVFLYSKNSYQKDLKYTVQAKYEYAGFYNLIQKEFFDLHYPLNIYADRNKKFPDFKELRDKILDEIKANVAKEMAGNGNRYFEGMIFPKEKRDSDEYLTSEINCDIFGNGKRTLSDYIFIDYEGNYSSSSEKVKIVDTEDILDYIDNSKSLIERYTKEILEKTVNCLFVQYEKYKLYSQKFDEIISDKSNEINKKKAIKEALKDKKSVNITILKDGKTFTFKTSTEGFIYRVRNSYSIYDIASQDRQKYREIFGYYDYTFDEIQKITYGKKDIYIKGQK